MVRSVPGVWSTSSQPPSFCALAIERFSRPRTAWTDLYSYLTSSGIRLLSPLAEAFWSLMATQAIWFLL